MSKAKKKPRPVELDHPGNMRVDAARRLVDNPLYVAEHHGNASKIEAFVNVRESAITALAAKGVLSPAQTAAADRYRRLYECMGGKGAGAMDYSRVVVDGGPSPDPIKPIQIEAGRELKAVHEMLVKAHGEYAYRLVGYIAGQGYSIHDLCETRRQRDTMTDNLRMYLDLMAAEWGFSTQRGAMTRKTA